MSLSQTPSLQAPPGAFSIALVAGEASGDLLASWMMKGLSLRWPLAKMQGIGGPCMQAQGFNAWWPSEKLAVRGYVEVLRHYREIVGIRKQFKARLLIDRPSVFIGVDAPDFNLDLACDLKQNGIPTAHFVCPSIWAWRAERIEKIRRSVDHVLCIFPFEPALLHKHGVAATFVGHPLAQAIPLKVDAHQAKLSLGLDPVRPVIALLPGSRASEIAYLAERFLQTAQQLHRQRKGLQFVLPCLPAYKSRLHELAAQLDAGIEIQILQGQSHAALAACDVSLIASGTATLEAALFKKPMVIAYNMNRLSWQIMKGKQLQPWIGLPNILAQDFVVPEFLQDQATPQYLAPALLKWLDAPDKAQALSLRFEALHHALLRDTPTLSADVIQTLVQRR
ncbi:MAG: lipid-A-disaccharide synthase [Burkholderiales bacterium]|nr:lipid-A-disaccharide synthase [Burkholderiales bacterium]